MVSLSLAQQPLLLLRDNRQFTKEVFLFRELEPGQVCLEQATALALRFSFLGLLIEWLVTNRNWKEGAYIVPKEKKVN